MQFHLTGTLLRDSERKNETTFTKGPSGIPQCLIARKFLSTSAIADYNNPTFHKDLSDSTKAGFSVGDGVSMFVKILFYYQIISSLLSILWHLFYPSALFCRNIYVILNYPQKLNMLTLQIFSYFSLININPRFLFFIIFPEVTFYDK